MRKFVYSVLLAGLTTTGHSQGTIAFQNFSNSGGGLVDIHVLGNHYVGNVNLELFWGPVCSTTSQLLALNNGVVFSTTITSSTPGKFFDGCDGYDHPPCWRRDFRFNHER